MSSTAIQDASEEFLPFNAQTVRGTKVIFDLGMNNGDDSAYYLSRGYRVVAIEANPTLAERARYRFEKEIAAGQMLIEAVGISERPGKEVFWINDERDVFSSFQRSRADRNGAKCRGVEVECVTLDTLLKRYGVPYYLKLDVEGAESSCLKCLHSFPLPQYISVEAEKLEYLQLLWQLGYREFALVDQMRHNSNLPNFSNEKILSRVARQACWYADRARNRFTRVSFPTGCSGPLATEARVKWATFEEIAYNWLHLYFGFKERGTLNHSSWYDFHARAIVTSIETAPLFLHLQELRRARVRMRFQKIRAASL
jgi:FkbM family methyltransferase